MVTGVGCEIECVGATELTDTLYISVRVTCAIKLNIKENFKIWMLETRGANIKFPGEEQISNLNSQFFDKEKIYFEAGVIYTDETLEDNIF